MKNKRREFLKLTGLAGISLAGSGIIPAFSSGKSLDTVSVIKPEDTKALVQLNRFPGMIQEYFVEQVRQIEQIANKRRSEILTKSDAEAYVREVKEKIQQCFGPWPDKTPLNARVTGKHDRDSYTIENVIFESRPGFMVTANLYIPKGRKLPLPAVVVACGHDESGKFAYSIFSGLARMGYVVLVFDPIGQGERVQYFTSDHKQRIGNSVFEHLYAGNQLFLTGESLSSWFAWDGIRAVDYLLSRKEVDPKNIGVTGVSGGGTQTALLCSADPRISMAAPCCWVTTFRHNMENEEVADTEQCPWRALSFGLDHSDFMAVMAPKPVILLGQEKDFFDIRGTEESFARLRHLYRLLGAEQNIELYVGQDTHSYPKLSREAMYRMFNAATKISDTNEEPDLVNENEETLMCTPHGQVVESGSKIVFTFSSQLSVSLKRTRAVLKGDELKQAVITTLKLPSYEGIPEFRILRFNGIRQYPKENAVTYMVETEPNICAIVYRLNDGEAYHSRPLRGLKRALLYISHQSADNELRHEPLLAELIHSETDSAIFACDVRGTGESQPDTNITRSSNDFFEPYGSDYFYSIHSIMLDYPYVGQKTFDILRVINLLKSYGHQEIHLAAKGWGAIPATFAALLSDAVSQVTLKNSLTSYSDIAENEEYNWPLQCLLPGVLKVFDLPDCYRALESKKLRLIEQWDALAGGI